MHTTTPTRHPALRAPASRRARTPARRAHAAATPPPSNNNNGGIFDLARRAARTVQGGLPVVGLLSRLAAPAGGVGWDELAYPEFARGLVDADARSEKRAWSAAVASLTDRHGARAQLRNVTLCLWMAATGGGGLVRADAVIKAARRAAVTNDIEVEVDRFAAARDAALDAGRHGPRPITPPAAATAVAVDALATLCLGLADGVPLAPEDAAAFETIIPPALAFAAGHAVAGAGGGEVASEADGAALVRAAVASRGERSY